MTITDTIKNRKLVYLLLFLAILVAAGAVFLDRYSYLFTSNNGQSNNTSYDVAKVEIKQLNTGIFQSSKFQSLQAAPSTAIDLNSLNKGKRNPFSPD